MNEDLERIKRTCWIENHICHIPLSNGEIALCDEDRFEQVKNFSWYRGLKDVRAFIGTQKAKYIKLHSFLYPGIKPIDHINGNILDNRSCNLRPATISQNGMNRKISNNNSSGYKGVYFNKKYSKYYAHINISPNVRKHLGSFVTSEEAAMAYDNAAKMYYGEYARLNFGGIYDDRK